MGQPFAAWERGPRFGAPGAGGSFAFADPDARLGYAYVMNKMAFHLSDDPREKALRDAIYRAIARARLPGLKGPAQAWSLSAPEWMSGPPPSA